MDNMASTGADEIADAAAGVATLKRRADSNNNEVSSPKRLKVVHEHIADNGNVWGALLSAF